MNLYKTENRPAEEWGEKTMGSTAARNGPGAVGNCNPFWKYFLY